MVASCFEGDLGGFLGIALDAIQEGVLLLDGKDTIIHANHWMTRRYPSQMPLIGKNVSAVLPADSRYSIDSLPKSLDTAHFSAEITEVRSEDGPAQWLEVSFCPVISTDGTRAGTIGLFKDVTERRKTEELLKDEISRRRILVEQSRDGIVILDRSGGVYEANEEYARMLGYSMEEVAKLHIWDWDNDHEKEELLAMIEAVDQSGDHFVTRHRRKNGTTCEVEISTNGVVYGGEKLVFCVCRDITEQNAMQERIRELAIRDPLTEVFNRRYAFERLVEIVAEYSRCGRNFCISILDIDHFKNINDSVGHLGGDFILREFARTIDSQIRSYDLLARYGGEEFLIVSTNVRGTEATAMLERLMRRVREQTFRFNEHQIRFTFSCGLADSSEFSPENFSIEAITALADKRLYRAKEDGRNRCVGPPNRGRKRKSMGTPDHLGEAQRGS